jgi:hypothetical protein
MLTALSALGLTTIAWAQATPPAVVLVTFDGARIEEVFGGSTRRLWPLS